MCVLVLQIFLESYIKLVFPSDCVYGGLQHGSFQEDLRRRCSQKEGGLSLPDYCFPLAARHTHAPASAPSALLFLQGALQLRS